MQSTTLSASLRLFLLVALCLSASITEAQKAVRLIEIQSGWGGLGTSRNADVIIRSKDGAFVRDGKPVDAAQVEALLTALKAPGVAKPDMENLGITSAWLKAHVASQHPRGRAQGTETTASQRELFATSFTNLRRPRSLMRALVDTNALLPSAQPGHPLCILATQAVSKLIRQNEGAFFCAQNISEFWNVATRPTDKSGLGMSPDEALQEVAGIEKSLSLLPDVPAIYPVWKQIVRDHQVQGVKVYDDRLVAIMQVYAVDGILTFNDGDFQRHRAIHAIHPAAVTT